MNDYRLFRHAMVARCVWAMLGILLLQSPTVSLAQSSLNETLEIDDDTETTLTICPADGEQLLIWIPSFATPTDTITTIARQLQKLGIEVWYTDLLEARFLPKSGSSIYKIPDSDITALLNHAQKVRDKKIYLYAESRATIPVLRGLRAWQQSSGDTKQFGGLLLNSPYFYVETPDPGKSAQLRPVVGVSNLPIYILQPEYSPRYWQLQDTVPALQQSGSDVFIQTLKNVRGRFHFRSDATDAEVQFTQTFGQLIFQSMQLLISVNHKPRTIKDIDLAHVTVREGKKDRYLQLYQGNPIPPPLKLATLDASSMDLKQFENQVVLVNFWATWCPPCVHEMPSMQRLSEKLIGEPFVILGVNIAEEESVVKAFLQHKVNVDFPILLDIHGYTMRQWNVMAFPTSFVIDKHGKIRYALFGSVDWDTPDIVSKIESLMKEK